MGLYNGHFRFNNQLERYVSTRKHAITKERIYSLGIWTCLNLIFFYFPYLEIFKQDKKYSDSNSLFYPTREETLTTAFKNKIAFTNLQPLTVGNANVIPSLLKIDS